MRMKKIIIIIILIAIMIVMAITGFAVRSWQDTMQLTEETDTSHIPDYLYSNASADDIVVNISEGQQITSPLTITGKARGSWFFEATAPLTIVNWDGLIIGKSYIQAEGDWMTDEFVPFTGIVEFEKPTYKNNGAIILQADNPSGLLENDKAIEIPITFSE